jgi:hypothetical protein
MATARFLTLLVDELASRCGLLHQMKNRPSTGAADTSRCFNQECFE